MKEYKSLLWAVLIVTSFEIVSALYGSIVLFQNLMLIMILFEVIDIQYRKKGGEK